MSSTPVNRDTYEPDAENLNPDAVCFAAGWKAAPFAAGVIHAYLAAGRPAPKLAAGISVGALSAAAMQRCYRELGTEEGQDPLECEAKRWGWFRRYLRSLIDSPLDVLWRAFPDPIDLDSDLPPVRDLSCPPFMRVDESQARRRYFLLIRLASWLARLPIRFSTLAQLAVAHVRRREGYGGFRLARWFSFQWAKLKVVAGGARHLAFSPQFVNEYSIRGAHAAKLHGINRIVHPLFGWWVWSMALALMASGLYLSVGLALRLALSITNRYLPEALLPAVNVARSIFPWWGFCAALLVGILCFGSARYLRAQPGVFFARLEIQQGLLSDYHLHRRLHELFAEESVDAEPRIESDPFPLLLVAAPLNQLEKEFGVVPVGQQLWAGRGARLIEALRAALAVPFLFSPLHLTGADVDDWLVLGPDQPKPSALDLVDGAAVRNNPIPAVVAFLRSPKNRALAEQLEGKAPSDCRLHLVSGIPTKPTVRGRSNPSGRMNIVEVAALSFTLSHRRDIQMECQEVNFLSAVEQKLFGGPPSPGNARPGTTDPRLLKLFVDEIVPSEDIAFKSQLAPQPDEILTAAAAGCRRTLEKLYRSDIEKLQSKKQRSANPNRPEPSIDCHELLRILPDHGGSRSLQATLEKAPGLPEICQHCSRKLTAAQEPDPLPPSFGLREEEIPEQFAHLTGEKPRICFLASGGVFRGATHIGVLGALRAAGIRPDLIVGASVGALIGGALGAISVLDDERAFRLLGELATTFREVDQKVALTRTLKSAARQLGVRARRVKLSPFDLQRLIERGTRSDAGFAATSAPPALVDAMSELTLLPYSRTREIATEFVAGHYTKAFDLFFKAIQKETLRRLDIEYEVMGTSLLAKAANRLLGGGAGIPLDRRQPFHHGGHPVSFFCTSSRLDTHEALLLGADFPTTGTAYDFIEAVLSSSAFPGIFSPRCEADLSPGSRRIDVLLADGGMFDNLPFYPAIEVLQKVQNSLGELADTDKPGFLRKIFSQPVLFIAAALEADPPRGAEHGHDDLLAIHRRSSQLRSNLKMHWFEEIFEHLGHQLKRLPHDLSECLDGKEAFATGIVPGGVLKIIPTDPEHINPTFAFCASTGLKADRVNRAIADGCFQTFRALAQAQAHSHHQESMVDRSITVLQEQNRIPRIKLKEHPLDTEPQHCPFFEQEDRSFRCPFLRASEKAPELAAVAGVFAQCIKDKTRGAALQGTG